MVRRGRAPPKRKRFDLPGAHLQASSKSKRTARCGSVFDERIYVRAIGAWSLTKDAFFEALLSDIYGERNLLADGSVPADLLFSNPEYLIEAHGLDPQTPWISFLAHDLVRDRGGKWYVLGQSTRAPAGLGYVLERRLIMSRVMGYLLRRLSVKRLSGFSAPYGSSYERTVVTRICRY